MTEPKKKTEAVKETKKAAAPATQFKGRYIEAVGKRKSAIARVRLYQKGEGIITVNGMTLEEYLTPTFSNISLVPLKLTSHTKDLNFSVLVSGGGKKGQADAIRHGISRTLIELEAALRPTLKAKGLLTRDSRIKERKKPGLKKARKAPQWAKR
ncbi:30S ribosomal protein S9 [Candidatus Falkowbacteria bacterium]|nr:30S ribosomal protein S9 [Candidatus Falkowbacteria bacterium]